ncbi:acyltransferase [Nonomuraea sp. NPDC050310]|uniref:acyltransferase family protein n=1 Tax=unclassified Nonomuraea TaxID=2593643 RepID=UPI0034111AC1
MPAMPTPPTSLRPDSAAARLAWLDALRGLGALAVVAEHLLTWAMPALRPTWFNIGMYGVLVFFLVSGYIIPVSLERRGDLRAFWIGRLFRLYPLYLLVIVIALALSWWIPIRREVPADASALASHATMLLDAVGAGGVVNTMWTLSYEMVFYLMAGALFAAGLHRGRGLLAAGFAAAAVLAGILLAASPWTGPWPAWVSLAGFALGLAGMLSGRLRTASAIGLGLMALALLVLSSRVPWFGLAVVAVLFAGTAIQRWERGEGSLWPLVPAGVLVALAPVWAIDAGWWWVQPGVWITTIVLAAATFAGAMALRGRRVPYALTWLGTVSYSLYLLHLPLLTVLLRPVGDLRWAHPAVQAGFALAFLVVLLPVAGLCHRYVEEPMQRLGRRLAAPRAQAGSLARSG